MEAEFRAKTLKLLGWGMILFIPAGLLGWTLAEVSWIWKLFFLPAMAASLGFTYSWIFRFVTRLGIDGGTIRILTLGKHPFDPSSPIEVWSDSTYLEFRQGKQRAYLNVAWFHNGETMSTRLLALSAEANARTIKLSLDRERVFGTAEHCKTFGFIVGYAAVGSILAVLMNLDNWPNTLIGLSLCAVFVKIIHAAIKWSAQVTRSGIRAVRFGQTLDVKWADIKFVTIESHPQNRRGQEWTSIQAGSKRFFLNRVFDDYPVLRDIVISEVSKIDPNRIHDKRLIPAPRLESPSSSQHP